MFISNEKGFIWQKILSRQAYQFRGYFLQYIQLAEENKEYWKLVCMNKFRHVLSLCLKCQKQTFHMSSWSTNSYNILQKAFHKHYITSWRTDLTLRKLCHSCTDCSPTTSAILSQTNQQFQIKGVKMIPTRKVTPASTSYRSVCSVFL